MVSHQRRSRSRFLCRFICLAALTGIGFFLGAPRSGAQSVSTPIPRHTVVYHAYRYTVYWFEYPPGSGHWYESIPYKWGYGDSIDNIGQGASGCNCCSDWFQRRLSSGCNAGCDSQAGADCSGYITRVWGRPINEKWGTSNIAANSTLVPYSARDNDLRIRMRMGDVFDDWYGTSDACHVVLLYYFDPNDYPLNKPVYYEENAGPCKARLNRGGWEWLEQHWGWWNGSDGYRPYRYKQIRDDIYLPWLSNAWYGWSSILYVRNNSSPGLHIAQHTLYGSAGSDNSAIDSLTLDTVGGFDQWQVNTSSLAPSGYLGGGVIAADTGTAAAVYIESGSQAFTYAGIYPMDSPLGLNAASTLYMPVFFYNQNGYLSKVFVQNAGSAATNVTATYYGDDGRTCSKTFNNLAPWGMMILDVNNCGWTNPSTPPGSGSVRLSASGSQPLAAMTWQTRDWNRVAAYNAFSKGSTQLYTPMLVRNFYGWNSTLQVQNLSGSTANVAVDYYGYGGSYVCRDSRTILARRHGAIDHGDSGTCMADKGITLFSARISSDQPVTAVVNQDHPSGYFFSYNTVPAGQTNLVIPFLRDDRSNNWSADILIQNTTGYDNVPVTVSLYDEAGHLAGTIPCPLSAYGSCELYGQFPGGFRGSAEIVAGQPVAAIANMFNANQSGDGAMGYNAVEKKTTTP